MSAKTLVKTSEIGGKGVYLTYRTEKLLWPGAIFNQEFIQVKNKPIAEFLARKVSIFEMLKSL